MINGIFNTVRNKNGLTAFRGNNMKSTILLAYRSPYARQEQDAWLERKLLSVYTQYYIKVCYDSLGKFWKARQPTINVDYGDDTFNNARYINDFEEVKK